jgi:DICT domain-containing protein
VSLRGILNATDGRPLTLTIYEETLPSGVSETLRSYFEPQEIRIQSAPVHPEGPSDFAVVHDDGRFLAASRLWDVYRYLDPKARIGTANGRQPPDVLAELRDRTFSRFDRRRMVMASREIERRAWAVGAGELHVGFQTLSRADYQAPVFDRLAASELDVHVYGHPDAALLMDVEHHAHSTPELADVWFLAFDGDGDDDAACAMAGEEVQPGAFDGMFSDRAPVAESLIDYLSRTYPPTGPETTLGTLA